MSSTQIVDSTTHQTMSVRDKKVKKTKWHTKQQEKKLSLEFDLLFFL